LPVQHFAYITFVFIFLLYNILTTYTCFFCLILRLDQICEQVFQSYSQNVILHHICLHRMIEYTNLLGCPTQLISNLLYELLTLSTLKSFKGSDRLCKVVELSELNKKTNSENVSTPKVGVLNIEFVFKLRIYRSLKSLICLKWIRKKFSTTLHTQFNYLT